MTALTKDVRELSVYEIRDICGGNGSLTDPNGGNSPDLNDIISDVINGPTFPTADDLIVW